MTDYSKIKVADAFKHLDPTQWAADDITTGFPSIRFRGKAWSLKYAGKNYQFRRPDDGTAQTFVDIVILGVTPWKSRVYFGNQGDWNEDSTNAPICASNKGDVPDPGVSIPQSKTCGTCDHSQWINKPGGGRGQECQEYKRLSVLLMPEMTKKMLGGTALMEPVFLKIPPGTFKSWKAYTDELITQGIPLAAVVTRVSFSSDRLFEMKFEFVKPLSNAEARHVLPMMEDGQTKMILGVAPEMRRLAAAAPPPIEAKSELLEAFAAAPAKSVPVDDDDDDDDAPPPPKRVRKPKVVTINNPPQSELPQSEPPPADEPVGNVPWEESNTDLDQTVARMMEKTSKMLR